LFDAPPPEQVQVAVVQEAADSAFPPGTFVVTPLGLGQVIGVDPDNPDNVEVALREQGRVSFPIAEVTPLPFPPNV
jgi:hypothetical protein